MCFGGGGSQATIQKPDYSAYNKQFDLQKSAIDQQMSNNSMLMQSQLQESLKQQTIVRQQVRDAQVAKAENQAKLEEEAQRLSVLVGTPPPEPAGLSHWNKSRSTPARARGH